MVRDKDRGQRPPRGANYDVAPDGKRIVSLMPVDTPEARQAQNHVVFLLNFFDDLRRKVPTRADDYNCVPPYEFE